MTLVDRFVARQLSRSVHLGGVLIRGVVVGGISCSRRGARRGMGDRHEMRGTGDRHETRRTGDRHERRSIGDRHEMRGIAVRRALRRCTVVLGAALLGVGLSACTSTPEAQRIVDNAIEAHGGSDRLDGNIIRFDFRDRRFELRHDGGFFQYERTFPDSSVRIRDVITNESVYREIEGRRVDLSDEMRNSVLSGVNSVSYFALLPFKLNDPAVRKRHLGTANIDGESYEKIEITFDEEGGGRDYRDRFIYWFHRDRHTMDYFAYDFEEDGGGTRFREVVHPRSVGGIRFVDHLNYTSDLFPAPGDSIEHYDRAFEEGRVRLVSEINHENVTVVPIESD